MKMRVINAKTVLSKRNILNFYRGCTNDCICCFNRSRCAGVKDFTEIGVKTNAPELFDLALRYKRKKCMIGISTLADPYQSIEGELKLFRTLLEQMQKKQFGVNLRTRSNLILRDLDLLDRMNFETKVTVEITLTTLDEQLSRKLEPNAASVMERIHIIQELKKADITVILRIKPIIPFITDSVSNLDSLLDLAFENQLDGILLHGFGMKINNSTRDYFFSRLENDFPGLSEEYESVFGTRFAYESLNALALNELFHTRLDGKQILTEPREIFFFQKKYRNRSQGEQLRFF